MAGRLLLVHKEIEWVGQHVGGGSAESACERSGEQRDRGSHLRLQQGVVTRADGRGDGK